MSLMALVMALFPTQIAEIYTEDSQVRNIAVSLLYMAAIFQISDGLQVSGAGALRGLKDTKVPMFITLLAYWGIGLPLGYGLGIRQGLGPQAMWVGLIVGLSAAGVMLNARFRWLTRHRGEHTATVETRQPETSGYG
jgi:MATE family multidrug resistance protein